MSCNRLNRRTFLAGAAASFTMTALFPALGVVARSRRPLRVIILGAGLAGLCAAYELESRGHEVILLEADPEHIGGRVRTLHFGDGRYGELGAMRIPASHHLTRHYVYQFGLPLRRFIEFDPEAYYFVGGHRERIRNVRRLDPRYAAQGIGWGSPSIWNQAFHEIPGGMERLPAAFVERLRSKPQLGRPVIRIESELKDGRAAVVYAEHGKHHRMEGDFIVCTLPVPMTRLLEFDPPLPGSKLDALAAIRYGSADKTLILTRRRFWESGDHIFGGATYTDLPIGVCYYPSDNAALRSRTVSAAPGVLLGSYTLSGPAKQLDHRTPVRRSEEVIHDLSRIHPQLREAGMVMQTVSWSWDQHPWSRGAFADPGQNPELIRRVASPVGRIHFAGEHTSAHATWMQGALESALRAVREILSTRTA